MLDHISMRKWILIGLAVALLFAVVAIPSVVRHFAEKRKAICLLHLRQINAAVETIAVTDVSYEGQVVKSDKIVGCIKGGPKCPSGGMYVIDPLGTPPTCSYHGNLLKDAGDLKAKEMKVQPPVPK